MFRNQRAKFKATDLALLTPSAVLQAQQRRARALSEAELRAVSGGAAALREQIKVGSQTTGMVPTEREPILSR